MTKEQFEVMREQFNKAFHIKGEIEHVKDKLGMLKEAQSWKDDELKGGLELRRLDRDDRSRDRDDRSRDRDDRSREKQFQIYLEEVNTVRTLIDILYCKYEAKLEELEKEFEEL